MFSVGERKSAKERERARRCQSTGVGLPVFAQTCGENLSGKFVVPRGVGFAEGFGTCLAVSGA